MKRRAGPLERLAYGFGIGVLAYYVVASLAPVIGRML